MAVNFTLTYLFIFIFHHVIASRRYNPPEANEIGWIKSCGSDSNKGNDVAFGASHCPIAGIWMNHQLDPGCICVNGLWVLSSDLCDDDIMIVYGQGHCFYSKKKIQKLSFLGSSVDDPFSPTTFVGHRRGPFIFDRLEGERRYLGNETMAIIRINPDTSLYYRMSHSNAEPITTTCIDQSKHVKDKLEMSLHKEVSHHSVSIIRIEKLVINSPLKYLGFGETNFKTFCKAKSDVNVQKLPIWAHFDLKVGQGLKFKSGKVIDFSEKCETLCTQQQENEKKYVDEGHHHVDKRSIDRPQIEGYYGWSYKEHSLANEDHLQRLVLEQNVRAIKSETEYMKSLDQDQGNENQRLDNGNVYKFLQVSRQLVGRVCQIHLISEPLLKSISRIFRYILTERRDANSYGFGGIDQSGYERIMNILKTCLKESVPWEAKIDYDPYNCHEQVLVTAPTTGTPPAAIDCKDDKNKGLAECKCQDTVNLDQPECKCWKDPNTDDCKCLGPNKSKPECKTTSPPATDCKSDANKDLPECKCYDPKNVDDRSCKCAPPNDKKPECRDKVCQCERIVQGIKFNETHNSTCQNLTDSQKWNYDQHDLIVETIWKLFQFTHYYCASHFEADGSDLSLYHERIERLFHSDILFRWYNPGSLGSKIWDFFYFAYDLKWFTKAIDACVCTAQSVSPYTEFMVRPEVPTFRRKRETESSNVWGFKEKLQLKTKSHYHHCLTDHWDPIEMYNIDMPESCTRL